MSWDTFFVLTDLLKQSAYHWLFSACAGLLVFLLIQTISSAAYRAWNGTASRNTAVRYSILGLALCCALLAAFTAHCYIDGAVAWWTSPINAPLVINAEPEWQGAPLQINTDPNRYSP